MVLQPNSRFTAILCGSHQIKYPFSIILRIIEVDWFEIPRDFSFLNQLKVSDVTLEYNEFVRVEFVVERSS